MKVWFPNLTHKTWTSPTLANKAVKDTGNMYIYIYMGDFFNLDIRKRAPETTSETYLWNTPSETTSETRSETTRTFNPTLMTQLTHCWKKLEKTSAVETHLKGIWAAKGGHPLKHPLKPPWNNPWNNIVTKTLIYNVYNSGLAGRPQIHSDTQTHRHTDTQKHRHTDTQTHRHTDTQTHRHTDTQTHRHTDTQTHRHTDKCARRMHDNCSQRT